MAWVSKFSGLPVLTSIPDATDGYAAGAFSFGAGGNPRDWDSANVPPYDAPKAYVDLATIGASISQVLRVTARYASRVHGGGDFDMGGGVALYGPGTDDASTIHTNEFDPTGTPGDGVIDARATENGTTTGTGGNPTIAQPPPHQTRLYWNGTGSAFIIPDAGFGSWSIAANTVSYWSSYDDGTTWVRNGDRAIAGGVAPTRAAIWGYLAIPGGGGSTVTFSNLEVMQEVSIPAPSDRTGTLFAAKRNPGNLLRRQTQTGGVGDAWATDLTPPANHAPHSIAGVADGTLWLAMQYFFGPWEVWRKLPAGGWVELATRSVSFNCCSPVSQTECWFTDGNVLQDRYIHGSGFTTWNIESLGLSGVVEFRQSLLHAYASNDVLAVGVDGSGKWHTARWNGSAWIKEAQINFPVAGNYILSALHVVGDTVYVGFGEVNFGNRVRLYKHTNKGIGGGWVEVGGTGWPGNIRTPNGIWVNPLDTNEIWVSFGLPSANGPDVVRSTDGGANWTQYTRSAGANGCSTIVGDPQGNVWVGHNQSGNVSVWNGSQQDWAPDEVSGSGGFTGAWWGTGADVAYQRLFETSIPVTKPVASNFLPEKGSINVQADIDLSVDVTDPGSDIDEATVVITVNGIIAWQSDAQQNSFAVTKTPISGGFRYEISPPSDLPEGFNVASVIADDTQDPVNSVTAFWSFEVGNPEPRDSTVAEDRFALLDAGGPPEHRLGVGVGQLIPGPVSQTPGSLGPFDDSIAEENVFEIIDAGGNPRHELEQGEGVGKPYFDNGGAAEETSWKPLDAGGTPGHGLALGAGAGPTSDGLQLVQAVPEEKLFYEVLPDARMRASCMAATHGAPRAAAAHRAYRARAAAITLCSLPSIATCGSTTRR
jgi:hypothetical protein